MFLYLLLILILYVLNMGVIHVDNKYLSLQQVILLLLEYFTQIVMG